MKVSLHFLKTTAILFILSYFCPIVSYSQATAAGTISPANTNVCSGSNFTQLNLNGYTGNIIRWESSLDNFATAGTKITSTHPSLYLSNLTTTTYYRALVQSGECDASYSNSAKIMVYGAMVSQPGGISLNGSAPFKPSNDATSYCPASTAVVSIAPVANASSYTWIVPTGWTLVSGQGTPTATYITGNISANIEVYASNLGCGKTGHSYLWLQLDSNPPVAPTITTKQPDCTTATGTITVTSPAPNSGITYTIVGTNPVVAAITNTSGVFSGLAAGNYNVTINNGSSCTSSATSATINPSTATTWNGYRWSNGTPTKNQAIIISDNYCSTGDLSGCSLTVNSGASMVVNSGHTLTIVNQVTASGSLTFEDTASLIQINNVANSGNIKYKRKTTPITKMDYTYWSSPVSSCTLGAVSPDTPSDKFYSYNPVAENWVQESPSKSMSKGFGYIIRGPQNYVPPMVLPAQYEASFAGVPNNGTVSISVNANKLYLLGNPYPSAMDADIFLTDNSGVLEGTLYFWTHKTPIGTNVSNPGSGKYAYSQDDYASYNLVGGVGTGPGTPPPTGKIASTQGFFTNSTASGTVLFNNNMRTSGNNSQFFKNTIEKHRIWLNLTNTEGAFKQTLLGYVTNATNDYEGRYDGESLDGNEYVDFYSINQNKNLVIQGRALPFDSNDEVPLGYRTSIDGTFTINIEQTDGLLTDQEVFLEDKLTDTVVNLKKEAYSFTTKKGTFDNRFVLKYSNQTLANSDFTTQENKVLVSCKNTEIKINSFAETIDELTIYDMSGRQIYHLDNVNSNDFLIAEFTSGHQPLIVKTKLQNGTIATAKISY